MLDKTGLTGLLGRRSEAPSEVVVTPLEAEKPQPEQKEQQQPDEPESKEITISVDSPPAAGSLPEKRRGETRTRQSRLFFISVTEAGLITMKGVIRPVQYIDAPLTATLEALLEGPTAAEVNQGLISLISPQTRVNTVYIKGDTAYIDFNEAFRFNSLGKEGMIAELKQVVYTSTEFSTVKKVQILVEGEVSKYLGPEGVAIDKPLGRSSF